MSVSLDRTSVVGLSATGTQTKDPGYESKTDAE
jgi:hypothetical protein